MPGYNGIVFKVAVSQTKSNLLTDITEWLDPNFFEVNVVIVILFEGYGLKDEDGHSANASHLAQELRDYPRGKIQV